MRHPYRTVLLVIAAVVLLTGCSTSHTFRLLLEVKNADDGQPVEGVTAVLDTVLSEDRKHGMDVGSAIGKTDAEGKVTHEFKIAGYTRDSSYPWYLKLQKEGFEPQVIDINPRQDFPEGEKTMPLPVTVRMRPLPKKP